MDLNEDKDNDYVVAVMVKKEISDLLQ